MEEEEFVTGVESTAEGTVFEDVSTIGLVEEDVGKASDIEGTERISKLLDELGGLELLWEEESTIEQGRRDGSTEKKGSIGAEGRPL